MYIFSKGLKWIKTKFIFIKRKSNIANLPTDEKILTNINRIHFQTHWGKLGKNREAADEMFLKKS